jgi:hypothetical protein
MKIFNVNDQVKVLDDIPDATYDNEFNVQPYIIEENIIDIDNLLSKFSDIYWNRTKLDKNITWSEFSIFWRLFEKIKHKREIGRQVTDVEYIYEHVMDDSRIKKVMSSELSGFTSGSIEVIYGQSNGIEIYLYQDEGSWEYVLSIVYGGKGITHWHPQNTEECLKDIKGLLEEFYLIKTKYLFGYRFKLIRPTIREKEKGKLRAYDFFDRSEIIKF